MEACRLTWLRRKLFVLTPRQLVWTHIVLQILDLLTTLFVVAHTNVSVEANPMVRWVLDSPHGFYWFAAIKVVACAALAIIIPVSLDRSPRSAWVWRALAILYLAVVLSNLWGVAAVCMLF